MHIHRPGLVVRGYLHHGAVAGVQLCVIVRRLAPSIGKRRLRPCCRGIGRWVFLPLHHHRQAGAPFRGQRDAAGLTAATEVWAEVGATGAVDGEMVDGRRGMVVALDGRGQAFGKGGGAGGQQLAHNKGE
ncbi:hypothetical protein D9M68_815680 [compost metagenome]